MDFLMVLSLSSQQATEIALAGDLMMQALFDHQTARHDFLADVLAQPCNRTIGVPCNVVEFQ